MGYAFQGASIFRESDIGLDNCKYIESMSGVVHQHFNMKKSRHLQQKKQINGLLIM